jgi:hypothetical protein
MARWRKGTDELPCPRSPASWLSQSTILSSRSAWSSTAEDLPFVDGRDLRDLPRPRDRHPRQPAEEAPRRAGGRVFTGARAFELGSIDKIGTLDDAIVHAAGQAGLSGYDVRVVPRAKNFLEVLMEQSGDHEADRKGLDVAARGCCRRPARCRFSSLRHLT